MTDLVTPNTGLAWSIALKIWNTCPGVRAAYDTVDDVAQQGMVGLCKAAKCFDPARGFQFSTYAYWCIRNTILYEAQQQMLVGGRSRELPKTKTINDPDTLYGNITPDHVADDASRAELSTKVRNALGQLSAKQQHAIRARYGLDRTGDWKLREIGAEMGVTKERVRQLTNEGIDKLRSLLA